MLARAYVALAVGVLLVAGARFAAAQNDAVAWSDASVAAANVRTLFDAVESEFECGLTLYGEPQRDEFSTEWFVTYSASGEGCDAAIDALKARGTELDLLFFRKPDLAQLRALLGDLFRAARAAGCQVSVSGEPSVVPQSGRWLVTYVAVGNNCDAAAADLESHGRELEITFYRRPAPGSRDRLLQR